MGEVPVVGDDAISDGVMDAGDAGIDDAGICDSVICDSVVCDAGTSETTGLGEFDGPDSPAPQPAKAKGRLIDTDRIATNL